MLTGSTKRNIVKDCRKKYLEIVSFSALSIAIFLFIYVFLYHANQNAGSQDIFLSLNIMAGSINGRFSKFLKNKLAVISLLVNNNCNLSCKHCYLQTKKNANYLSSDDWDKVLVSVFSDIKPTTLCFAGKEVFYNQTSANILFNAIQLRDNIQKYNEDKTEIGMITNGTLIHNYKKQLENNWPDYFDISIDGLPHIHNKIRGEGAFERLENNLIWLKKNFFGNIWITHTIFSNNIEPLPSFINYMYSNFGITKYSIGLYKDKYYTDQELKLSDSDVLSLFNQAFHELASLLLNEPIEIILEMDHTQKELLPLLLSSGWIEKEEPFTSTVHTLKNGLSLKFNIAWVPVGLWRSVRITPEGYWLAAEDLMEVKNYEKFAVANIRDYDYDLETLYHMGLKSERFFELTKDYRTQIRKSLSFNQVEKLS